MIRYLRIFFLYFRLGILNELEYRANFWVQLLETIAALVVALGSLSVIFFHTDNFGGWRQNELIALVAVYLIIMALINLVIEPSMTRFVQTIVDGSLDHVLSKPADSQFLVSIQQVRIWKLVDLSAGFGLLGIAIARLGQTVRVVDALSFVVMLICGVLIVYSFWLILATSAFWIVRAENIFMIFNSVRAAGRWPVTAFPQWMRILLTYIVPIAFAITVPAQTLVGRLAPQTFGFTILLTVSLFVLGRLFWLWGLRNYSGASA